MTHALQVWNHRHRQLFPVLTEEPGSLTDRDRQFVEVMALLPLGRFLEPYRWGGVGCPPHERAGLVPAFIAKGVYEFPTTRALLDARPARRRLCGWDSASDVPHESTFSRAFAAFADAERPQQLHAALIQTPLGSRQIGLISRDATAIAGGEKPAPKPPPAPRPRRANADVRPKEKGAHRPRPNRSTGKASALGPRIWPTCPKPAPWVASATVKAIKKAGLVSSRTWTPPTGTSRSAPF